MATNFSYAQAAKGRVPVAKAAVAHEQEHSNTQQSPDASSEEVQPAVASSDLAEIERNHSEETLKVDDSTDTSSKDSASKSQSISNASTNATPSLEESTLTLNKEDGLSSNTHDSESATWEKVSQTSHGGEKENGKEADADDESKTVASWEHVRTPEPVLKEAPPPSVNPWTKRAQDAQVKASVAPNTSSSTAPMPNGLGVPSNSATKKKARSSFTETNGPRVSEKPAREEGATRRYKPSSETRLASRLPPPATDAMSWPTPESAKQEDKDKPKSAVQERVDSNEDKVASAKRGKTQWAHIPFVPTPVFNTPLPTSRRGGRPAGRGGRDAASGRGAASTSGTERSDKEGRTPSIEAPAERSRNEGGHARPPRAKRMSNAGQTKPRDFKKVDENGKIEESAASGSETARASKTGGNGAPGTAVYQNDSGVVVNHTPGPDAAITNGSEAAESVASFDTRTSRQIRDGRNDAVGQGREFNREANGVYREGRGGRGGHRGRGGHHSNYAYGSYPNGGNFATNAPFTPRSHGYGDRQGQSFSAGRDNRHYRSGSRSQPGGPPPQTRFPAYSGLMSYPQGNPQPDLSNGYGYGMHMAQNFYHPALEQAPQIGLLCEQLRYYMSMQNLVRDTYLRSRMDDQGFIPLNFLMPWRRLKTLTDDLNMVRFASLQVPEIENRTDVNGVDYIRPANDWQKWVLPRETRLDEARNAGPQLTPYQPSHQYAPPPVVAGQFPPNYSLPPHSLSNGSGEIDASPQHHSDSANQPQMNGHANESLINTPLSATVPEFQPDPQFSSHNAAVINGLDNFHNALRPSEVSVKDVPKKLSPSLADSTAVTPPVPTSGPVLVTSDE